LSLTILQVAYPFAPTGPDAVGGAEQVLSLLDHALAGMGHRSVVVACEGSATAGPLLATPLPAGPLPNAARQALQAAHRRNIECALNRHAIDLVHMHGLDFHAYLPPPGVPVLATLHLPPAWYPRDVFHLARPETWLHCVSWTQHRACPPCAALLPPVGNGVAVEELPARVSRRGFALSLGRICPEKNQHQALEAGSLAGVPVLLGGQVFPYAEHERYWHDAVARVLAEGRHRFLGVVGFARKRRLLSAARCLVSTSLAPETSSLVAMEALACGTPVVAFPSGALPEIVEHGVTGFLVRNPREMAEAILEAATLDPEACRATARRRFSAAAMVARYADLYALLARPGQAHAEIA
jgi:glycosyltransferase involved in cell wall biosynthesis